MLTFLSRSSATNRSLPLASGSSMMRRSCARWAGRRKCAMSCMASAVSSRSAVGATCRNVLPARLERADPLGGEEPVRRLVGARGEQVGVAEGGIGTHRGCTSNGVGLRESAGRDYPPWLGWAHGGTGRGSGRGAVEPAGGPGGQHEPARLRISDEDRHKVAEVLRQAAGEGRIDLDELDERLEATYAGQDVRRAGADHRGPARSQAGPAPSPRAAAPTPPAGPRRAVATRARSRSCRTTKRLGAWQLGETHSAFSLMGSVVLDLREARFARQRGAHQRQRDHGRGQGDRERRRPPSSWRASG